MKTQQQIKEHIRMFWTWHMYEYHKEKNKKKFSVI